MTQSKLATREERGKDIVKRFKIVKTPFGWRVPSETSSKSYLVRYNGHQPSCNCADCELRKSKCKHIYAVEFYIKKQIDDRGNVTETKGVKVSYTQEWKAYDNAQTNEKLVFLKLLKDLCDYIEQPTYEFGRPKLPFADMIFASALKVYSGFSLRRFMSDLKIAKEMRLIDSVPCYASIGHFMQKPEITDILQSLIRMSSSPLKEVESSFAVDSSGFSTSRFARYFSYKHGKEIKYQTWIKAHIMTGVKTNIVTSVEITDGNTNDSPSLPHLVEETAKTFKVGEVSGDRAYSSRKNLQTIEDVGAVPYIPFKRNAIAKARGSDIWKRMYHYFIYKQEEFLEHYHKRSNVETVFHMIKTKFRDGLRSKTKEAQTNELLLKFICHNIVCVIQEISELGIKGEFVLEEKG
ncbi:MAG: transposase [Nanoarchaeota archaeon]